MKTIRLIILAVAIMSLTIAGSCGSRQIRVNHAAMANSSHSVKNNPRNGETIRFTEEDYEVMAMPLEQRITYLENKYKELVFQMHGIRIEGQSQKKNVLL